MPVFLLSDNIAFPPVHLASKSGLLAVGGDLSQARLLCAYRLGIFPWFSEKEPILWWSPDPRLVLYPDELKIARSLKKNIKKKIFKVTADTAFEQVINQCAKVRLHNNEPTWIVDDMIRAYIRLHESGIAHSVEAWHNNDLVGGLYGVSIGRCFFGESMFTLKSNASKVAFVRLVEYLHQASFQLIDCQMTTEHLLRFGAKVIPRKLFVKQLHKAVNEPYHCNSWIFD
jgi:leucyl/phenylalanyl-tRNA--protein transferase